MADNKIDALVTSWNTDGGLNLTAEQEEKLKALLNGASAKARARREGGKQLIEHLQKAVDGNDAAALDQLLGKLREGLRGAAEGREKFLDEFDQALQADQRARFLLYAVKQAKESGKTIEQFIDDKLTQDA